MRMNSAKISNGLSTYLSWTPCSDFKCLWWVNLHDTFLWNKKRNNMVSVKLQISVWIRITILPSRERKLDYFIMLHPILCSIWYLCYSVLHSSGTTGSFLLNNWRLTEPNSTPQTDKQNWQTDQDMKKNQDMKKKPTSCGSCPMAVSCLGQILL